MRHSEIVRIRWKDIDTDRRRIHVPKAKAGQREQPIASSLADALAREFKQRRDETWVFPAIRKNTKTPHRPDFERPFQRAVVRAGLGPQKVTPHVMRHTGITRLVKAGVDIPTIQRISGHKTLAMVMRYVHLEDDHIDQSIDAIGTGFLNTITPELHTRENSQSAQRGRVVRISEAESDK